MKLLLLDKLIIISLLSLSIFFYQLVLLISGVPDKEELYRLEINKVKHFSVREDSFGQRGFLSFFTTDNHFFIYQTSDPKYISVEKFLPESENNIFFVGSLTDPDSIFEIVADGKLLVSYIETCRQKKIKRVFNAVISIAVFLTLLVAFFVKKYLLEEGGFE